MRSRGIVCTIALAAGVLVTLGAAPAFGAGFLIFEHGAKAMGMAGAFTAQADDGSAMFHNAAGLAFQQERRFDVGTTLITNTTGDFEGAAPFPGPGASGEQKDAIFFPSHAYYVQPITQNVTFGVGFNDPFGLVVEWDDVDNFPGRFISYKAELRTFDLNPTIAWRATPSFGIGVGLIGRWSDLELNQRVGVPSPFGGIAEVGDARLSSDLESGYGWNVGVLHKPSDRFSWGLSYRSAMDVDYEGDGRFTQISTGIPPFDAAVAAQIPFGQDLPIATTVDFPDLAIVGVAFGLTRNTLLEIDVQRTGWSDFEELRIDFETAPQFSRTIPEQYEDAYAYRAGLLYDTGPTSQWRFGYVFDETPQPEEAVGPLLPDSDRNGVTLGYGFRGGWDFDIALMYLQFDERTRDETFPPAGGQAEPIFHGTYDTEAFLLGLTLGL
jgi:long-chain fatty acid transport protein